MTTLAWMLLMIALNSTPAPQDAPATSVAKPPQEAPATGFLYKTLELQGNEYAYSVYVPPEYKSDQAWPAILFLHGSGERGGDGLLQTEVGIGTAIRRHRGFCPAIVILPQCRPNMAWEGAMAEMALKCVEKTSHEYRLDADRLYLTGLSLGGAGAWQIGGRYANQFAAVVPICGFVGRPDLPSDPASLKEVVERLANVPVWCYHGTADTAVKAQRSQEIIAALRAAGGAPRYTEVPDIGHNVWDTAYANPELWKWLLAQKRPKADEKARSGP